MTTLTRFRWRTKYATEKKWTFFIFQISLYVRLGFFLWNDSHWFAMSFPLQSALYFWSLAQPEYLLCCGYDDFICNMVSCALKCQHNNVDAIIPYAFFRFHTQTLSSYSSIFFCNLQDHASANVNVYGFCILCILFSSYHSPIHFLCLSFHRDLVLSLSHQTLANGCYSVSVHRCHLFAFTWIWCVVLADTYEPSISLRVFIHICSLHPFQLYIIGCGWTKEYWEYKAQRNGWQGINGIWKLMNVVSQIKFQT